MATGDDSSSEEYLSADEGNEEGSQTDRNIRYITVQTLFVSLALYCSPHGMLSPILSLATQPALLTTECMEGTTTLYQSTSTDSSTKQPLTLDPPSSSTLTTALVIDDEEDVAPVPPPRTKRKKRLTNKPPSMENLLVEVNY